MPSYLSLMTWTDEGVRGVNTLPERIEAMKRAAQAAGGRLIFYYMLMGEYDAVSLLELPDDETAAKTLLSGAMQGEVRTKTLKAFTEAETRQIVASLGLGASS